MLFLDVQGTLISDIDKSPIEGSLQLFKTLNKEKIPYVVITNNTKNLNFLNKLQDLGFEIKENAYIDPFHVLKDYLKPCKVAAFGSKEFLYSLEILGYEIDFKNPQAFLVASYDEFKFEDFAYMNEYIKHGIKAIAMHEGSIYKKNHRLYPGVGSIMAMLKNSYDFEYCVVGKPSKAFYTSALNLLKIQNSKAKFEDVMIISDDYKGDLIGAKELGMQTSLVLSGKISDTKGLDLTKLNFVYDSIKEYYISRFA
ncbi:HAD-IIA family hydrolase [Campylobacter insulaenigrae]|uniref:HAD-superfamily hydrolase, subfamily IIA n=1 Tax=Campylobacter insulaenigrae NCTC 12927 TaxID=1031564 RepID=A0A0A8H3K9_9BACT|nr:HAD-IIA family hydrolase [Campylobacter insulaenigrae]AJC88265.1 HAD-superfamily hydrolase, subfamily IIA [Campylobacter insulaenigrae NCTC 12927]VEH95509.1 HAD-superfamily hydrolase, subfamily IIA [Campylobacter insulaenigrae]